MNELFDRPVCDDGSKKWVDNAYFWHGQFPQNQLKNLCRTLQDILQEAPL